MSSDDIGRMIPDTPRMVDYVKVRPFFNSAYVVRGKDDLRTAKIPDVVVSISDAARTAFAGLTAQQISELGRYRSPDATIPPDSAAAPRGDVLPAASDPPSENR